MTTHPSTPPLPMQSRGSYSDELQPHKSLPLISVIVTAFNAEDFLGAAIDSIFAQDYRPLEVIVVDDGSTDNTAAIARSYLEARHVYEENQGVAVARNTGLALSSGELVAFLDADDLWSPHKLTVQAQYLAQHPDVQCVNGMMINFLQGRTECPFWIDPQSLQVPSVLPSFCAILAHRGLFDLIGGSNPSYRQGQDLEWFMRLEEQDVEVPTVPDTVLMRRIHAGNISHNQSTQARIRLRMLKESLDRKRRKTAASFSAEVE